MPVLPMPVLPATQLPHLVKSGAQSAHALSTCRLSSWTVRQDKNRRPFGSCYNTSRCLKNKCSLQIQDLNLYQLVVQLRDLFEKQKEVRRSQPDEEVYSIVYLASFIAFLFRMYLLCYCLNYSQYSTFLCSVCRLPLFFLCCRVVCSCDVLSMILMIVYAWWLQLGQDPPQHFPSLQQSHSQPSWHEQP